MRNVEELGELASGYVYCVSLTGVTGERKTISAGLPEFLERVKKYIKLPRAVGKCRLSVHRSKPFFLETELWCS